MYMQKNSPILCFKICDLFLTTASMETEMTNYINLSTKIITVHNIILYMQEEKIPKVYYWLF